MRRICLTTLSFFGIRHARYDQAKVERSSCNQTNHYTHQIIPEKCLNRTTFFAPAQIYAIIAAIPRRVNLEMPQTPWPDVQPFASLVPKPSAEPAIAKTITFLLACVGAMLNGPTNSIGTTNNAETNARFSIQILRSVVLNMPEINPLASITQPLPNKRTAPVQPIKTPPNNSLI